MTPNSKFTTEESIIDTMEIVISQSPLRTTQLATVVSLGCGKKKPNTIVRFHYLFPVMVDAFACTFAFVENPVLLHGRTSRSESIFQGCCWQY